MYLGGSIRRGLAGLFIVGSLGACGFQPMYSGQAYRALPGLEISANDDRVGYLVEDALRDHLGGGQSRYQADLLASLTEVPLGLSAVGRASRFRANLSVTYRLTGPDGFSVEGRVTDVVYYDAPRDPFAQVAAKQAAEERGADLIAVRLVTEFTSIIQRHENEAER